jgi:hypothetical protein
MPFLAGIKGFANPCLLACLASRVLSHISHIIHAHSDRSIAGFHKGAYCFWERGWGTINSASYREHIVSKIAQYIQDHPGTILM